MLPNEFYTLPLDVQERITAHYAGLVQLVREYRNYLDHPAGCDCGLCRKAKVLVPWRGDASDREALGPCGKHPRMFSVETDVEYTYPKPRLPESKPLVAHRIYKCTLCEREAAQAEAVLKAAEQACICPKNFAGEVSSTRREAWNECRLAIRNLPTTGALERREAQVRETEKDRWWEAIAEFERKYAEVASTTFAGDVSIYVMAVMERVLRKREARVRLEEAKRWHGNWNVDDSIRDFNKWALARIAELEAKCTH